MDQNLKQTTLDNLTKAQSILVAVSENSGLDGLAAGLSLFLAVKKLGKNVSIFGKNPTVDDAQKLYGVDNIGNSRGTKNLVIVVANAVETVDRVSHYLDGDKLKLTLHAFPGSTGPAKEDVSFSEEITEPDVIFAVGFESEETLRQYVTHVNNISPNAWLVNINTKDLGQIFAQVNVFDQKASGLSEITSQVIGDLALPMDEDIAFNLYQGILESTQKFSPALVGPQTFETASYLIKFGAGKASFAAPRPDNYSQPSPTQPKTAYPPSPTFDFFQPQNQTPIQPQPQPQVQNTGDIVETPINQVEREKSASDDDWLNPPKIYSGSKSFDSKE